MSNTVLNCHSEYVTMRDGVRLAVSTWLANDNDINNGKNTDKRPAVVITTRYWRAMALKQDNPEFQTFYPLAAYLWSRGYVLAVADARGTGASFGTREGEISSAEVVDIGELIDWVAQQDWCDGRVATNGRSYTANTALHSLASGSTALKLSVGRASDFDVYRHLLAPGGVINRWFVEVWGSLTAAQDANDVKALRKGGYWNVPDETAENVLGVRPVDDDRDSTLLAVAISEHTANFNAIDVVDKMTFIDSYSHSNSYDHQDNIEQGNLPIVIRCGWHDAATALGALSMFASFSNPMRVIIGPWNHRCDFRVDPFKQGDGRQAEAIPIDYEFGLIAKSLDAILKKAPRSLGDVLTSDIPTDDQFGIVEYYTLGENQWKTTPVWPLAETRMQRLYLSADHQLSHVRPEQETAYDIYQLDLSTTGVNNRWGCQMGEPVFFNDRQEDDKKLQVYDTPPLEQDIEITGHPVVSLFVRSTASDGQFFVYLETIDPDGRVRLLTDGQLRALHRKVSDEKPPFTMFGPYHSFKEKDAEPLIPDEVAEIAFDLLPISVLLKKGQRIRLTIAGTDSDVFAPIPGCESPGIIIERNSVYASCIDLPCV